ncbi:hypothetical protein C1646_753273 [Rhizophagus diaphanus]|nr:hypothetical protein C1646_753273 [Rhizophagus diaphanus] [Rhizophagus sp. MUCL 43196]
MSTSSNVWPEINTLNVMIKQVPLMDNSIPKNKNFGRLCSSCQITRHDEEARSYAPLHSYFLRDDTKLAQ